MELDKNHPPQYSISEALAYQGIQDIVKKYDSGANIEYEAVEKYDDIGLNVEINVEYDDLSETMKEEILNAYRAEIAEIYSHSTNNFTIFFK